MLENHQKICKTLKKYIDIVLIMLLAFLSIKKGGFYKTDNLEFNLLVTFIGSFYIIFMYIINILRKYIKKKDVLKETKKIDVIEILLLTLPFLYLLPIIFNNYSNLSDSIFEMIRYFNIYIIYVIVKRSDNKMWYIKSLIFIVFIQCLFGIDGIANRYFLPLLEKFDSGYLTSINLTRMSATIQYANVFSLLCILVDIYLIDKFKNLTKTNFNNVKEYFFIFVFTSSIILSKSRVILLILLFYLMYILFNKKTNNKFFIFINILLSITYSTIFMKFLLIDTSFVYLLTFSFYLIVVILYSLRKNINNIYTKIKTLIIRKIKKQKNIYVIFFILIFVYIVLAINIKVPTKLVSNVNQNYISRNIYNLKKDMLNEICIKIKKDDKDSRYKIDIYEVNKNFESKLLNTYNYYDTVTDTFKYEYELNNDIQNLMINITCENSGIQILELSVNNKVNYIDYLLLPTDIMYRILESFNGDSSFEGRIGFVKDAISIIKLNPKNFFIGLGGEGFKNVYNVVRNSNNYSTEVHNVYLQIFVECGIIGFIIFILLIIYALKNTKFNIIKLLFIIFCITSLFDLNFSYMFTMAIFAILLALLKEVEIDEIGSRKYIKSNYIILELFKTLIVGVYGTFLVIILLKANIAYYMKVPELTASEYSLEQVNEFIKLHERRVFFDKYEISYRYNLHLAYEKYFLCRKEKIEEDNNIVNKMEENLFYIQKYDKYNVEVCVKVTEELIEYLEILVNENYTFDKEDGYEHYLKIIFNNINYIEKLKNDSKTSEVINLLYEYYYNKLLELKWKNNYEVINKYIEILKEKI